MEYRHPSSPSLKNSKLFHQQKVLLTIFWDARGVPVNSDDHSSNASTESGRKETRFFCIKARQGHIAVHKLRTP
jgi:hypothetical protein